MKPKTQLRILDHIRRHQTASVRELSQFLGMTGANIRHHIVMLESNDLIEIVCLRKKGRGRPAHIYGVSRHLMGNGLDVLAGNLLEIWLLSETDGNRDNLMRTLGERLAGPRDDMLTDTNRLSRALEKLNEMHYQARWEARAAGPRFILGYCPYAAIISEHPELCRMDKFLLEAKLGTSMMHAEKLQLSDKGLPFCAFQTMGK